MVTAKSRRNGGGGDEGGVVNGRGGAGWQFAVEWLIK